MRARGRHIGFKAQKGESGMLGNLRLSLLGGAAIVALGSNAAFAQESVDQGEKVLVADVIIVEGFRSSLGAALELKRDNVGVTDSIVAEDIADFPDLNISEALQRLTGVTITRQDGEGQQVSVRGLAPEFTRVTVNGLTLVSGNTGREVDFDVFASELFNQVTLIKTPSASLTEGGLAATIDLRTPRPFDYDGFTIAASGQGYYNDLGDAVDPRAALLISHKNDAETFGALFSVAYSDRLLRGDKLEGFQYRVSDFDIDMDGTNEFTDILYSWLPRHQYEIRDRSRLGLQGALQFRPTSNIDFAVDVLYAEFDETRQRNNLEAVILPSLTPASALTVENGLAVSATFEDAFTWLEGEQSDIKEDLVHVNGEVDWALTDAWKLRGKAGFAEANGEIDEFTTVFQAFDQFSYQLDGERILLSSAADVTDGSQFFNSLTRLRPSNTTNRELSGQLEIIGRVDLGPVTQLSAGVRTSDREINREAFQARSRNSSVALTGDLAGDLPSNFLDGFDGLNSITDFAVSNFDAVRNDPRLFPDTLTPVLLTNASFEVQEDTIGGYVMADVDTNLFGLPLTANAGVRVVNTDQTSIGTQVIDGVERPITVNNNYTDVLPSANLKFDVNDDLVFRIAASRSITRATLLDLAPFRSLSLTTLTGSSGNPELDPFRATQFDASLEWYFAEESLFSIAAFYKDIDSFIVDIVEDVVITGENLIDNTGVDVSGQTFSISRPVNGESGFVRGFEVSYQQPFTFLPAPFDGFGLLANYTFADSETTLELGGNPFKLDLPGQSRHSYNVVGYYEKGPFSGRLAYSWRDDFIRTVISEEQLWTFDAYGQLDFATRYDINDNIALTFEGLNLLREKEYLFDTEPRRPQILNDTGRTFLFGVRASF